jgi:hypothetical protein
MLLIMAVMLVSVVTSELVLAQNSTHFKGIISSDTTWTKSNSPYILDGNVLVDAVLTIEPGTTVYLYNYDIKVSGTLIALGSNTEQINFQGLGTRIEFSSTSREWSEQSSSGSIKEKRP